MTKNEKTEISKANSGLEGVVAADTALSLVDGNAGRLVIAGYDLPDLVAATDFEGAVALLWSAAGRAANRDAVKAALGKGRELAFAQVPTLLAAAKGLTITEALRVGLSLLPDEHELDDATRLVAAMPVFVAALSRLADEKVAVAPNAKRGHAEDYLTMLNDTAPDEKAIQAMDTYLTTVSDHGMNASTFTGRVVASTAAGQVSSILAALCALKGPLHGGAPGPVLDMLDDIGSEKRIEPWLREAVMAGDRLMGFGHRIYRVRDPRADVLGGEVKNLAGSEGRIAFALKVEETAKAVLKELKPHRPLDTNVEFYTALLLEALGIPRAAFTPTFAVGRVAGWTAHVMEQDNVGRLIRPASNYVGIMPKGLEVA